MKEDKVFRLRGLKMCTKRSIIWHLSKQHFCLAEMLLARRHSTYIK